MKRTYRLLYLAATAYFALLSCSKDIVATDEKENKDNEEGFVTLSITAKIEDTRSKVGAMDANGKFAWAEGDEIAVLYNGGSTSATAHIENSQTKFSPSVPSETETIWMVYPKTAGVTLNGNNLDITMPAVQKNSMNGLFIAKASATSGSATFYHPVCYYKFIIDGDGSDVTSMNITSSTVNLTASTLSIGFDSSNVPSLTNITEGAKSISVNFSGDGAYYIPIVPGTEEIPSGDITFQFFRNKEDNSGEEKAGGYLFTKALTNSRAS
nr:hypothetical protein [Bacteroidales bacterium]